MMIVIYKYQYLQSLIKRNWLPTILYDVKWSRVKKLWWRKGDGGQVDDCNRRRYKDEEIWWCSRLERGKDLVEAGWKGARDDMGGITFYFSVASENDEQK